MNASELRDALKDVPDDAEVYVEAASRDMRKGVCMPVDSIEVRNDSENWITLKT